MKKIIVRKLFVDNQINRRYTKLTSRQEPMSS